MSYDFENGLYIDTAQCRRLLICLGKITGVVQLKKVLATQVERPRNGRDGAARRSEPLSGAECEAVRISPAERGRGKRSAMCLRTAAF